MDELEKQVVKAYRRIMWQQFLSVLTWSLFVSFAIALIGIAIPKFWPTGVPRDVWVGCWLSGAFVVGIVWAVGWTLLQRRSPLNAAMEIDRRFGLKERVSSGFALSEEELATAAGQALVQDAARRVERLDISSQFPLQGHWKSLLPILPAAIAFLVAVLVPDALTEQSTTASANSVAVTKQVKKSTSLLEKKWAEQRKQAEAKQLESAQLLKDLEKGAAQLNKMNDVDKTKALVKLSDLAKQIENRRQAMGDVNKLQERLKQIKNLKPGPASKMAKAIKKGDLKTAVAELSKLKEQLDSGKMSEQQRKEMAAQLNQLADKLNQVAEAHEQAKEELKKQIDQAKKAGDLTKATELKQKLDQLREQNNPMQQLAKMSKALKESAKDGKGEPSSDGMKQLVKQLESMATELEEMEMLDDAMEQLADAKDRMNCKECEGDGCSKCMGSIASFGTSSKRGDGRGMGEGNGRGDRPESETDKNFYDSRVRAQVRKGKAVTSGFANGENLAGDARVEIQDAIEASSTDASDPLSKVNLPKTHREHAREYFESFTQGDP